MEETFIESQIKQIYHFGTVLDKVCYLDSYIRLKKAGPISGKSLPPFNDDSRFGRIWGSRIKKDDIWLTYPEMYRVMGAPCALAMAGWSKIIWKQQIWNGALLPGAVLQSWKSKDDYNDVKKGIIPSGIGHSFVFIRYEKVGNII